MQWKRIAHALFRIGLLVALITALFWGVWSFFAPVPSVTMITMRKGPPWALPISRWYDPFFMFLLVNVVGWLGAVAVHLFLWCMSNKEMCCWQFWARFGWTVGAIMGLLESLAPFGPPLELLVQTPVSMLIGSVVGALLCSIVFVVLLVCQKTFWLDVGRLAIIVGSWLIATDKQLQARP